MPLHAGSGESVSVKKHECGILIKENARQHYQHVFKKNNMKRQMINLISKGFVSLKCQMKAYLGHGVQVLLNPCFISP